MVSKNIQECNPDILFLEEIYDKEDIQAVEELQHYPYQEFINTWYHEHSILVASKIPFTPLSFAKFETITCAGINFVPVHLHSFSAAKRLEDALLLSTFKETYEKLVILGDMNIWQRGKRFLFNNDKQASSILALSYNEATKSILHTNILGFSLDKVFNSPSLNLREVACTWHRGYFMDHYPVSFIVE